MQTTTYKRKTFQVDAVQVTDSNLVEVAAWCKGEVKTDADGKKFVKVKVHRPMNRKQTEAYPADWVLLSSTGFKVYPEKAFESAFEQQEIDAPEAVSMPGQGNIFDHAAFQAPQELRVVDEPAEEDPEDPETILKKIDVDQAGGMD